MSAGVAAASTNSPTLRCPKCGNDGASGRIRCLVDVVCQADVVRLFEGVLELDGSLRALGGQPHDRPRLECVAAGLDGSPCGHRWPVPEGVVRVASKRRA